MNINVYFLDKTVAFRPIGFTGEQFDTVLVADDAVTRAKVLKILESCNRIAVLSSQPDEAFARFAADFKNVGAAGGVVTNLRGEMLLMHRRGRWDLPKGHIEPGEQPDVCARREVAEETGIANTETGALICKTYHAYNVYGEWELKCTHWFEMVCDGSEVPVPQHEEGIEEVVWVPQSELGKYLQHTYPTIRQVFNAIDKR